MATAAASTSAPVQSALPTAEDDFVSRQAENSGWPGFQNTDSFIDFDLLPNIHHPEIIYKLSAVAEQRCKGT
jgi:hypothetical protein